MLSAFTCSFDDAEPALQANPVNLAAAPVGRGNPLPTPAPRYSHGAYLPCPRHFDSATPDCRLASGKDRGSHGAGYVFPVPTRTNTNCKNLPALPVGRPDPSWTRNGSAATSSICRMVVAHWR